MKKFKELFIGETFYKISFDAYELKPKPIEKIVVKNIQQLENGEIGINKSEGYHTYYALLLSNKQLEKDIVIKEKFVCFTNINKAKEIQAQCFAETLKILQDKIEVVNKEIDNLRKNYFDYLF